MVVSILVSERRDKKGGFAEKNSSEYSISKGEIQDIFESGFASNTIVSAIRQEVNCILSYFVGRTGQIETIKKHQYKL